jgi:UDP-N-acetylmuramoyl-L-alanyl-D-glutamate--2,6-diaminopimelate ligase
MDAYFNAKLILFEQLKSEDWAVINGDDPKADNIIDVIQCHYLTYGFSPECDVNPSTYSLSQEGIDAEIRTPKGMVKIKSSLVGRVNLSNILTAVASAVIKGVALENIASAIRKFQPVRGRMDFAYRNDFSVLIDYAHTDEALAGLLSSLREITKNRIVLVFGAGGSRDKTKRPRMGKTASALADWVVVTSDNPRKEDPEKIMDDIIGGFESGFDRYTVEADRERAISKAIGMAVSGDIVVVAGKGHEDYQIFADRTIHFDDYEVVRRLTGGSGA